VFIIHMPCAICAEVREFEQPPCVDRHEPGCPEWACTTCGTAVLLEPPLRLLVPGPRRAPLPRQRQRHLAA
jgi:hypothetical protein